MLKFLLIETLAVVALSSRVSVGKRVGHMRQYVEEVALFGVDDLLHLGQLIATEAVVRQSLQELLARARGAP